MLLGKRQKKRTYRFEGVGKMYEYVGPPPDPRALPTEAEWEWLSDWYGYPNYHEGRTLWAFLIDEITESQEDESRGLKIRLWQYKLLDKQRARIKELEALVSPEGAA